MSPNCSHPVVGVLKGCRSRVACQTLARKQLCKCNSSDAWKCCVLLATFRKPHHRACKTMRGLGAIKSLRTSTGKKFIVLCKTVVCDLQILFNIGTSNTRQPEHTFLNGFQCGCGCFWNVSCACSWTAGNVQRSPWEVHRSFL